MREEFEYVICGDCNSTQIAHIPDDISKYYPTDYYSFTSSENNWRLSLRDRLLQARAQYALGRLNFPGMILSWLKPPSLNLTLFRRLDIEKSARILDVGCGGGELLDLLSAGGYKNLLGVDPFIKQDITTGRGVTVLKRELRDAPELFDVIMLHHCLEHMAEPAETLRIVRSKLRRDGMCIIRIPTTSSEAWDRYKAKWVQLDPPRHFVIPSRDGMAIMGKSSGLKLVETIDDSSAFQFWASEQYLQNISLSRNGITDRIDQPAFPISKKQRRQFDRRARDLNHRSRGDQAAFIYRVA